MNDVLPQKSHEKKKTKGKKILDLIEIHEIKIELLKLLSCRNKKQFMLIKVRVYFMNHNNKIK